MQGGGLNIDGLRYGKPQVSELDMAKFLSEQELGVLFEYLEEETDAWMTVSTDLVTKQLRLVEESHVQMEMEGEGDNGGESDDDDDDNDEMDDAGDN